MIAISRRALAFAPTGLIAMPGVARAATDSKPGLMTKLGTIRFPNSGNAAVQAPFLTGVKALHNFQFDEATEAFRAAQQADPNFALGYWGEAMSYNAPLWARQDVGKARAALNRYAPSPEARAEKAPTGKERALLAAVDVLFGPGEKLARDTAYSKAMETLHKTDPADDELAVFYALSLLGTVRPGDKGVKRQMEAGAISLQVFARNPQHPGAAHFVIHSFDDPEHAILALPAAQAYSKIAADSPHALHMPSHIFVQLGMWDGVVASNDVAFKAAVELAERKNLERGSEDFHTLSWMQYGYIQLGRFDEAKRNLDTARAIEREHPTAKVSDGVMSMLARYVVDTERWDELPADAALSGAPQADDPAHANHRRDPNVDLNIAKGLAAAARRDVAGASRAADALKAAKTASESQPGGAYRAKMVAVGELEVRAALAQSQGETAKAEDLFKQATAIEGVLDAPSGPPQPMKPSFEMYGEFLLSVGRNAESATQFELALARTPNRTRSAQGLARARPQSAERKS